MLDKFKRPANQYVPRNIVWLVIILSVATFAWGGSNDSNIRTSEQTFRAKRLEVSGFSGRFRVEVETRVDLAVQIRSVAEDIDGISLNVRNGVLHIEKLPSSGGGSTSSSVTVLGNVTTVVSGGGTASVNIGGQDFGTMENHPPIEITIRLPTGTPLSLHDLNGDCRIGDTYGSVELTLSRGNCTLGEITRGELLIQGSGDIVVRQVSGDLRVGVNGSGNVRVHSGRVGRLEAKINGSGQINLNVQAQQAELSLVGAGNIHVTEVREQPRVTMAGAGGVKVDNW